MSFYAKTPQVVLNDIPIGFNMPCEPEFHMELAISPPAKENPYLCVKISPKISLKRGIGHPIIYSYQVKSEFAMTPMTDIGKRDEQIYNYMLTAVSNLNDLFSISHNIPTLSGAEIRYEEVDFEKAKKTIHLCFMGGIYPN